MEWHARHHDEVCRHWAVDPATGLSAIEVEARQREHGPNESASAPPRSLWRRLWAQLAQPLIVVLIAAGIVTTWLGEYVDATVIFIVVVLNALIGLVQEAKAESALAALAKVLAANAQVLREGREQTVAARHLVPGDVVLLGAGDKVPADIRMLHAHGLHTAEAALTGESLPVRKHAVVLAAETPLAERQNMIYAGTSVVAGRGRGIVVATGGRTETGRIAHLIALAPDLETPLVRKMASFSNQLLVAILALGVLTFLVGWGRGEPAAEMFMAAVALAVGAIPEGLPAAMTVVLAIGVGRMARRRAIVRHLPAIEALGSTTTICSDKTGTLTENAMTVTTLVLATAPAREWRVAGVGYAPLGAVETPTAASELAQWQALLQACVLCNDARLIEQDGQWQIEGDPTEGALLVLAAKGGVAQAESLRQWPRRDEIPFDADRRLSASLHRIDGTSLALVKGALESLLPACAPDIDRQALEAATLRLGARGLRVLALARKPLRDESEFTLENLGQGLELLGLVGMIDPPRAEARAAVAACRQAGIRVKMITGDHPVTALAIARELGIAMGTAPALSGRELAALDDEALRARVEAVDVYARVEPEQKLRLVLALQARGHVVAMTGDGVNDAPALKHADIGVAMGRGGTEVAKESAAMVLTDDNFASLEAAVETGRGVYDNLVKFITWTIPTNAAEGLVILAAVFAGTQLPITPLQILWINMATAVLLGMPLAFEPIEGDVMRRPPRAPAAPVLDADLLRRTLLLGLLMLAGAFGLFQWALAQGRPLDEARTLAANVFVLVELGYLFCCRSLRRPLWAVSAWSNAWVWWGAGTMLLLQLGFTYLPAFNAWFETAPLPAGDWLLLGALMALGMLVVEIDKHWSRR